MRIPLNIPKGESGDWKVSKFTVSQHDADIFNVTVGFHRYIEPGEYYKLTYKGLTVMSNTPSEIRDHIDFIRRATGNVLINGLGLGMCVAAILDTQRVETVIVIEKSQDVIDLVGAHIKDDRVRIIHADALEYKPRFAFRFDAVWHDIWSTICSDNVPEMIKLHRKYGRHTNWQGSWARKECELLHRREQQEARQMRTIRDAFIAPSDRISDALQRLRRA